MKRLLAIVMMLAFSCSEKEEMLNSRIFGTWEAAYFAEDLGFESVNRYIFLPDGTYFYEWGYRVFAPPSHVTRPPFVPKDQMEEKPVSPAETNKFQYMLSPDRSTLTIRTPQMNIEGAIFLRVD